MLRTEFKAGAVGYRIGERALPVGRGVLIDQRGPAALRPLWAHIAVPYLLFAVAEQTVDSSTAGISTRPHRYGPCFWPVRAAPKNSVTTWQAAGLIVGFGGALLISRLGAHRPAWHLLAAWNAWPHQ
jgi:hypothetical protein